MFSCQPRLPQPRRAGLASPWPRLLGLVLVPLLLVWPGSAHAAMDYAKQVLIGADFHGADLREVTFSLTNLREDNLAAADLREIGRAHV